MYITGKKLKDLQVYTKSNQLLGKIEDIEIDCDSQAVQRYIITSHQLIKKLTANKLIIQASQVVSIDEKKMVVEDSAVKQIKLVNKPATF